MSQKRCVICRRFFPPEQIRLVDGWVVCSQEQLQGLEREIPPALLKTTCEKSIRKWVEGKR